MVIFSEGLLSLVIFGISWGLALCTYFIARNLYKGAAAYEKVGFYKYVLMLNTECFPFGKPFLKFEGERLKAFRIYKLIIQSIMMLAMIGGVVGYVWSFQLNN